MSFNSTNDIEVLKYTFDLQGFIVINNVLSEKEINEIQTILDQKTTKPEGLDFNDGHFGESGAALDTTSAGFLSWGKPFCNLLDHPKIMPVLQMILGNGFRIDHMYGVEMVKGTKGLKLHGGSINADATELYHAQNNRIYTGLSVVSWNLVDTGPSQGGFLCIPGSHKQNFQIPESVMKLHYKADCVKTLEAKAGSVIIFTEALAHGTAPWKSDNTRRSLLFKYTPSYMAFTRSYAPLPTDITLTKRQKDLYNLPSASGSFNRPTHFE